MPNKIPDDVIAAWKEMLAALREGHETPPPRPPGISYGHTRITGRVFVFEDFIAALLAEREEMLALLREVEWHGPPVGDIGKWIKNTCPACSRTQPAHAPDCRLAAFLQGA